MPASNRRRARGGLPLAGTLGLAATLGALTAGDAGAQQRAAPGDSIAVASAARAATRRPSTPAPDAERADATATATAASDRHAVRRGDTLWDISAAHLGTPYRWPEIDRANKDVIRDPHWIYPGQRLRLPDGREITVGEDEPTGEEQAAPEMPSDAPTTVFARRPDGRDATRPSTSAAYVPARGGTAERAALASAAEWYSAPFVTKGVRGAGYVAGTAELAGARASNRHAQLFDRIAVAPPKGVELALGTTLLLFRDGGPAGKGNVMLPTGLARVEELPRKKKGMAIARVTRLFSVVEAGQGVTAIDPPPADAMSRPPRTAAEAGPLRTTVRWVEHGAELPTVQARLILGTSGRDDVQVGDEFTLYRAPRLVDGRALPEQSLADVRVVRVTPLGATAVVVRQDAAGIAPGLVARRGEP